MRLGINGFGRIGRMTFKAIYDRFMSHSHKGMSSSNFCVAGLNDSSSTAAMAHLLKFDCLHGTWDKDILYDDKHLIIDGIRIPVSITRDPSQIPWDHWKVDVVLECTGAFKTKEALNQHLRGSVKKVLISAPAKGSDVTICYGVNHQKYDSKLHKLISNASCTTNCLAPLVKVLDEQFGVVSGFMTTIHAYTSDQRLLDNHHKDFRRMRAAAQAMIPTSTGAAQTVGEILPHLNGKIDGISVRVPTPNVSLVDLVAQLKHNVSVETVNRAIIEAANGDLKGVLAVEKLPLVSRDFLGHTASCIVDLPSTMVLEGYMVKVLAWYDNEVGFSHRMVDLLEIL